MARTDRITSFSGIASSHPGNRPYDTITLEYGEQTLWPDHCVWSTRGADFHSELDIPHAGLILRKGFRPAIDSYSAFFENDHKTETGLRGYLEERALGRVFIAGLALDFCVRFSIEDSAEVGFETILVEDACRAVDIGGSRETALQRFTELGIERISAQEFTA